jgi:hypothetical protein
MAMTRSQKSSNYSFGAPPVLVIWRGSAIAILISETSHRNRRIQMKVISLGMVMFPGKMKRVIDYSSPFDR